MPSHLEVVHLPYERGAAYPGIFLFTQAARMARPVRQTASGAAELLGSLEQHNMAIRCPDGGAGGSRGLRFTHEGGWGVEDGGVDGVGGWVGGRAGGWVGRVRGCVAALSPPPLLPCHATPSHTHTPTPHAHRVPHQRHAVSGGFTHPLL